MHYFVIFDDNTQYNGGSPENSRWLIMPDKPITSFHYFTNRYIIKAKGYSAYNHIVERATLVQKGKTIISKIILMLRRGNVVDEIIIDKIKNRVYTERRYWGKEYGGAMAAGWKRGVSSGLMPKTEIIKNEKLLKGGIF